MKEEAKFSELERLKIVQAAKTSLMKSQGEEALDYLMNERGFSKEVISQFELGYCPPSVNHKLRGRIISPIYGDSMGAYWYIVCSGRRNWLARFSGTGALQDNLIFQSVNHHRAHLGGVALSRNSFYQLLYW